MSRNLANAIMLLGPGNRIEIVCKQSEAIVWISAPNRVEAVKVHKKVLEDLDADQIIGEQTEALAKKVSRG